MGRPTTTAAAPAAPSSWPARRTPTAKGHPDHRRNNAGETVAWTGWCTGLITSAADHDQLLAPVRVAAAGNNLFVDVTYHWRLTDGLALLVNVVPSPGWDCTWPRVGVRFDLPRELRHASWFGTGPNESYPDTRQAARVGRFAADIDELNVAYSRPQETGHRSELR